MKKVLIRSNASLDIGFGHYSRTFSLAEMLNENKWQVHIMTNKDNPLLSLYSIPQNVQVKLIENNLYGNEAELNELISHAKQINANWIVLDGYVYDKRFEKSIMDHGIKLLRIDDTPSHQFNCDVFLCQNFGAEKMDFQVLPETKLALGLQYLLLRKEVRNLRFFEKNNESEKSLYIVISLGGSLAHTGEAYSIIANAFAMMANCDWHLHFFIPSSEKLKKSIFNTLNKFCGKVSCDFLSSSFSSFLSQADFAIVSGGSTMWESIYLGIPYTAVALNSMQVDYLKMLSKKGVCFYAGDGASLDIQEINQHLMNTCGDQAKRRMLKLKYNSLIDRDTLSNRVLSLFDLN